MIDQTLTTPPDAPSSNDIPTFRTRFDDFIAWIVTFVSQLSTVITQINSTETTINQKEASAVSSAQVAVAAANFKGKWSASTTYLIGESVLHDDGITYSCLLQNSNNIPSTSPSKWMAIPKVKTVNGFSADSTGNINVEDKIGTPIASASTITIGTEGIGDYLHITGTTTITSFGTASKVGTRRTLNFDGALTLTHGSSLLCPASSNITTIAGMIIEVIAETTTIWRVSSVTHPSLSVSELGYLDGVTSAIQTQLNNIVASLFGVGQTWQDMTGSRAFGTTYTNSTGKDMYIAVNGTAGTNGVLNITINGALVPFGANYSNGAWHGHSIIPNGATYSLPTFGTIVKWSELR